jgi:hypothetical protein
LITEGSKSASNESLRKEGMNESVPVVGKHKYLLEISSRTDGKFEDILF